jgi:hypothetical protein
LTETGPNVGTGTSYRCGSCGNLTRFEVTSSRRTRAFHHFGVDGSLAVEDEEVLESVVERVVCHVCGASGSVIEEVVGEGLTGGPAQG